MKIGIKTLMALAMGLMIAGSGVGLAAEANVKNSPNSCGCNNLQLGCKKDSDCWTNPQIRPSGKCRCLPDADDWNGQCIN